MLFAASLVFAQAETGRVTGVIMNAGGDHVADVQIIAHSLDNGATRKTSPTKSGTYMLSNLKPGSWEITVEAPGMKTEKRKLYVTVGTATKMNFELSPQG